METRDHCEPGREAWRVPAFHELAYGFAVLSVNPRCLCRVEAAVGFLSSTLEFISVSATNSLAVHPIHTTLFECVYLIE